jgi:hypothetical protein
LTPLDDYEGESAQPDIPVKKEVRKRPNNASVEIPADEKRKGSKGKRSERPLLSLLELPTKEVCNLFRTALYYTHCALNYQCDHCAKDFKKIMDCVISYKDPKCARCTTGKRSCLWKGKSRQQWYAALSMPTDAEVVEVESEEEEQGRKRRRVGSPGTYFPSFYVSYFAN